MSSLESHRRVKSDRVNALRKQYDAFLEEDKKRKERNEYILGKLDNMRYSSAAVQIRHKPIAYGDLSPAYNRGTPLPEQRERHDIQISHPPQNINHHNNQNLQLDIQRNYNMDNASLLKEISKKYILIPKLRSSLVNDYIGTIPPQSLPPNLLSSPQPKIDSNEDWKSKYEILEQLKKKETKEQSNYVKEELFPVKESQILSKDDSRKITTEYGLNDSDGFNPQKSDGYNLQNYSTKEYTTKYENEVPEKDLSFNKIEVESELQNVETSKVNDSKEQEPNNDHAPKSSASTYPDVDAVYKLQNQGMGHYTQIEETVLNTTNNDQNVQYNIYPEENIASGYNTEEANVYNESDNQLNENTQLEYPEQNEQPIEVTEQHPDSENVYLNKNYYRPEQVLNSSKLVEEVYSAKPTEINNMESKEDEVDKYPVEMLNVQEFTPSEDVKLIDGVNINPIYLANEQNIEPLHDNIESETGAQYTEEPQDSSGIEAFDTEQKEMFYSEDTAEFGNDQQQGEEGYNQEYAPPAQDYSYYESPAALQEQAYPVEINEHEESSTRYDQNYEQQYATEYENQEYQGQEHQQYDQTEGYDQTQEQYQNYEFQEPDQETVQSVEQGLDSEQGYVNDQETSKVEDSVPPSAEAVVDKSAS